MRLHFKINYHCQWGQKLCVSGSIPELGSWDADQAAEMNYTSDGNWELLIDVDSSLSEFEYKYCLIEEANGTRVWETGKNRPMSLGKNKLSHVIIHDYWRPFKGEDQAFYTSAFTQVLMSRKPAKGKSEVFGSEFGSKVRFRIYAPRMSEDKALCLIGSTSELGEWDESRAIIMNDRQFPLWEVDVVLPPTGRLEYKYGIYDRATGKIETWEYGENRLLEKSHLAGTDLYVMTNGEFRYPGEGWKAAGVALPVFSLRTAKGMGVGEFTDLKTLVDWSAETGMKMVQILPVNDTVATHKWTDSYPYAAISVFALHPIYANLDAIARYHKKKLWKRYQEEREKLNALPEIDYEAVMAVKSRFFSEMYGKVRTDFLKDEAFLKFFEENRHWLVPYAAFSYLRDKNGTPAFSEWESYQTYDAKAISALVSPDQPHYDDIAVHYFIQFHLDHQLQDAADYSRKKGVVLKGDIPIGIYRNSVDAWTAPHLYNMDCQAGAPPDAYAVAGQNWRFPTYNWHEMAKDNYDWWRQRLSHMARYFDAYRIDHILGFFRIWEIPKESVQGLMGQFNPSIPLGIDEIRGWGVNFDYERYCQPYIRGHFLHERFGEYTAEVINEFLDEYQPGHFHLKPHVANQRLIADFFAENEKYTGDKKIQIRDGLMSLAAEVLFLEAPFSNGQSFNPRIALHHTRSYKDLDGHTREKLNQLYTHYFYHRQEDFWREQAMTKLPAIVSATDMLVIGEDLGMVPDCVPGVMHELGLLSLEIQRMPKGSEKEFAHPADAPYLSVASPSCHDMSTIRGWWEEDGEVTQKFYNDQLGHHGAAPQFCEPWIAREMIVQHMYGRSMWAIFPIQDLLAMDPSLRREVPQDERINVPSNPEHYWNYRLHLNLEDLLEEKKFNQLVKDLVVESGRDRGY
jgi:4-alpha-glucanotransferase